MRRRELQLWGMLALCASCAWGTPSITQVSVRQQWPWSADIAVDFHLANDEGTPVDVAIVASNSNRGVNVPARAVSGPRIGLTASGDYRLVVDPAKLGAGGATVLGDFSVTLSIAASRADRDFPLYRIYNLSKMTSTNVTVKALLNGEWGDVETDYEFVDGSYRPSDVLIWTGVTNNPAYKTNCLVMRYVPAGTYTMLEQDNPPGTEMKLTEPFYAGVFEMTQGQCAILNRTRATAYFTNETDCAMRPMGSLTLQHVRGDKSRDWPVNDYTLGAETYIARLRGRTSNNSFDLPTEAKWEHAARAGCTTRWYNGVADASGTPVSRIAPLLCRYKNNGGLVDGAIPSGDSSSANGTAVVGSYLPNAWGLYDCIGNVAEWCLDRYSSSSDIVAHGPYTDWPGNATNSYYYHVVRGGHYGHTASQLHVDYRKDILYTANYQKGEDVYELKDSVGFRVVCDAEERPVSAVSATLDSVTASAADVLVLKPDASPFWRTAKAGEPVTVSIDWPDGAATATCTLSAAGQAPLSETVVRNGSERHATLSFSLPVPSMPDEERVYAAELTFAGANDAPLAAAVRQAQIAVVLGEDGGAAVVRAESGDAWTRYVGTHVTLPVAAGMTSLTIDGTTVCPGLNGAVGWYGTTFTSGMHTLAIDEEEGRTIFFKGLGLQIIIR